MPLLVENPIKIGWLLPETQAGQNLQSTIESKRSFSFYLPGFQNQHLQIFNPFYFDHITYPGNKLI